MNLNKLKKEQAKRDINFWSKVAEVQDGIIMLKLRYGMPIKRDFDRLMKDERKACEIEL